MEPGNIYGLIDRDWVITNIHCGHGDRKDFIYAELRNSKGELIINASLAYIMERVTEMVKDLE